MWSRTMVIHYHYTFLYNDAAEVNVWISTYAGSTISYVDCKSSKARGRFFIPSLSPFPFLTTPFETCSCSLSSSSPIYRPCIYTYRSFLSQVLYIWLTYVDGTRLTFRARIWRKRDRRSGARNTHCNRIHIPIVFFTTCALVVHKMVSSNTPSSPYQWAQLLTKNILCHH